MTLKLASLKERPIGLLVEAQAKQVGCMFQGICLFDLKAAYIKPIDWRGPFAMEKFLVTWLLTTLTAFAVITELPI